MRRRRMMWHRCSFEQVADVSETQDKIMDEPSEGKVRLAVKAERQRCAKIADGWRSPATVSLRAGEMTAQEMRTAQAVALAIATAIRRDR